MAWCGYIDLLGSRDDARRSAQSLLESLDSFHSGLIDAFDEFDGDCFAFSDGAFFKCGDYESARPFLIRIRNQMFQGGKYFRCSFLPGTIGVHVRKRKKSARFGGEMISYTFTETAPEAYQRELTFKGVGCIVDTKRVRFDDLEAAFNSASPGPDREKALQDLTNAQSRLAEFRKNFLVNSFFIEIDSKKILVRDAEDFRYSAFELSSPDEEFEQSYMGEIRLFDQLIFSCYSALARSSKVASYYLSALASIVRSLNLADVDRDVHSKSWMNTPYPFRELMAESSVKLLKEVPGFHLILLACFDQLYRDKDANISTRVETAVIEQLLRVPSCFRNLDRVPEAVISAAARNRLVELKLVAARTPKFRRPPMGAGG